MEANSYDCDLLVIGSGGGGLSAAVTARLLGLDVLVVEKAHVVGGTTATSGGVLWIPGNSISSQSILKDDTQEKRLQYLHELMGDDFNPLVDTYLEHGPKMIDFLVAKAGLEFDIAPAPDYHPALPGGVWGGRSLSAKPVRLKALHKAARNVRPMLAEMTLFGMSIGSGNNLADLFKFGRSVPATARVAGRLARHAIDVMLHGRSTRLVNGNALMARLTSAFARAGGTIWTTAPVANLLFDNGAVTGAVVNRGGQPLQVRAKRGVILATGGIGHNVARRQSIYRHPAGAEEHLSLTAPGNVGDGLRLAESAGGHLDAQMPSAATWMPVSRVPRTDGTWGAVFHSVNTGKPGVIAVLRNGQRFVDESRNYHDLVGVLLRNQQTSGPAGAFLICDHRAFQRYGLGYAKPHLPLGRLIQSGYLIRAQTISELAEKAGVPADALMETITAYNRSAAHGQDPEFGKGQDRFGHFMGDFSNPINPNVAPLDKAPYYAVWMQPGDVGNFAGIKTDASAQVLDQAGHPVPGLYAVGNDMASVFRGHYPGGGSMIGPAMTFGYVAARKIADARAG